MMNVTHRARHHRHIYGMVVRGPHFHNLRKKNKNKKIKIKPSENEKKWSKAHCLVSIKATCCFNELNNELPLNLNFSKLS